MSRLRRIMGPLIALGMMLPVMAGSASAQDGTLCEQANMAGAGSVVAGYKVVVGTGTSGHQIVLGYGGAYLSGGSGNDVLCAWGGGNTLDGGSGNDVLIVMEGTGNTLLGDSGNDTLIGYVGDVFDGGSGKNEIIENEAPAPEIIGTWEGTVDQGGISYSVTVTITGGSPGTVVGTSNYPTLGCGGNLVLVSSEPSHLTVTEHITYGFSYCEDLGTITLDFQSDGSLAYAWFYSDTSTPDAAGPLYPVP